MKKFYVSLVVLLFAIGSASAQNLYWIGPANGDWNSNANWSATSGGSSAGTYPKLATDNVIFNANATIHMNTSENINSVTVMGSNTSVVITATGGALITLTVNSTNAGSPGLSIASTCKLENTAISATEFKFVFVPNGQAAINGDWYFTGDVDLGNVAYYDLPLSGASTAVNINNGGSITIGPNAFIAPNETTGDSYLKFNSGGSLNLLGNSPIVPVANYNPGSIINITGVIDAGVTFEEDVAVGTINYNCPNQNNTSTPLYLSLLGLSVEGNLNILNTNDKELALLSFTSTTGLPSRDATIKGNLNIQGATTIVAIAHNDGPEIPNNLTVFGNVIANGKSLSIHSGTFVSAQPTKLIVKGNIQHTAGQLTAFSTAVNQTTDLFIIEMNGTSNQTISSVTGTFDNAAHQVTLRMNNAAGATLSTSLEVGRIDFSSANKGVLTTNANILTINNTTPVSATSIVVHSPSSQGYVDGIVQRKTLSSEPAVIPIGGASGYRGITVIPNTATATIYQARYINSGYSDLSSMSPLDGVTPDYYWDISRVGSGADAVVQLTIPGAVTNAQANQGLVVAKYNGSDWINTKGSTGTMAAGTATSGTVKSELQTTFSLFTIGFGLQSALPTLLVSFDGKLSAKENIDLKWQITENSTPSTFEVMRSADGINFGKIGSVNGDYTARVYRYTDQSILSGNNYYRLKMIDKDGSITYTTIIVVSNGAKGVYLNNLAPTIVRDRAKLNITSSANTNMQLVVTDLNGRIVHKQSVSLNNGSQDVWLDAARFSAGMFQVTGYVNGEKTVTLRFIKL